MIMSIREDQIVHTISQAAQESGVSAKTIRYYERIGLIPSAQRRANGYRYYTDAEISALRFVHRARSLGFSLKDVENLLELWRDTGRTSASVKEVARRHIDRVDRKLEELHSIRSVLIRLVDSCHGDSRPECPIINNLAKGPEPAATVRSSRETSSGDDTPET